MGLYHFVTLDPLALDGAPLALPAMFSGLPQLALNDLSWTAPDHEDAYVGRALWPVVDMPTPLEWHQRLASEPSLTLDVEAKVVRRAFAVETRDLEDLKAELKARVTEHRKAVEIGGFLWQRAPGEIYWIATDVEESQGKLAAERRAAQDGVRRAGDRWKCGNPATGAAVFLALSDAEVIEMTTAARNRTSDAFNAEGDHYEAIDALENQAAAIAYDRMTGWPS